MNKMTITSRTIEQCDDEPQLAKYVHVVLLIAKPGMKASLWQVPGFSDLAVCTRKIP